MDSIERAIAEIRADNRSGALALTRKAAGVLQQVARGTYAARGELYGHLLHAGRGLIAAQPAMAPIFNLVNAVLLEARAQETLEGMQEAVLSESQVFLQEAEAHLHQMAPHVLSLIDPEATVLTHSHSTTVSHLLGVVQQAGVPFRLVCTEARPMLEGRDLAQAMASRGIPTTLVPDALAFSLLQERTVSLVLLGADSLSVRGVVNKAGTLGIALAARHFRVPCHVVCGSEKFIPEAWRPRLNVKENRDPREVWDAPVENVRVLNRYFDVSPLELFSGVLTEEGILSARRLVRRLAKARICEDLLAQAVT